MPLRPSLALLFAWTLAFVPSVFAAEATTAPATTSPVLLADRPFISEAAGVSFDPPLAWRQVNKPGDQEIVQFTNDKGWTLRVTSATLDKPLPLLGTAAEGKEPAVQGMLDIVIDNFKKTAPDADILRNEVINLGAHAVGMVAARYTLNGQVWLRQQAMIQSSEDTNAGPLGNDSARLYYVFNFVTPAGKEDDARLASDTFSSLIDSVKLLDRLKIRSDQDERLYRTHALFMDWKQEKFEKMVVPKQYFRVLKNGQDAGWVFQEELLDMPNLAGVSAPGPIAYERTHVQETDDKGTLHYVDSGIFQYMSYDRKQERWTRSVVSQMRDRRGYTESTYGSEFGESTTRMRRVFAPVNKGGEINPKDPKAPASKMVEEHFLDVTITGKEQDVEPIHRDLQVFYLPQAGWHFLPRLVVDPKYHRNEPRTFLFSVYNPPMREVMLLYVDVSAEGEFNFAGKKFDGFTVTEYIGLGGAKTVHYVQADGAYLGSDNRELHLTTVISTEQEVLQKWPKANLTRPEPISKPAGKTP